MASLPRFGAAKVTVDGTRVRRHLVFGVDGRVEASAVREAAVAALETLCATTPMGSVLGPFKESLMHERCLRVERMTLGRPEREIIEERVKALILGLSPLVRRREAQVVLEFLASRYDALDFAGDEMLAACLPTHRDSNLVGVVARATRGAVSEVWGFLRGLKRTERLSRAAMARACLADSAFVDVVCDVGARAARACDDTEAMMPFYRDHFAFTTGTLCAALELCRNRDRDGERLARRLLPRVSEALRKTGGYPGDRALRVAYYAVVVALAAHIPSPAAVDAAVAEMAARLESATHERALAAAAVAASRVGDGALKPLAAFADHPSAPDSLKSLSAAGGASKLVLRLLAPQLAESGRLDLAVVAGYRDDDDDVSAAAGGGADPVAVAEDSRARARRALEEATTPEAARVAATAYARHVDDYESLAPYLRRPFGADERLAAALAANPSAFARVARSAVLGEAPSLDDDDVALALPVDLPEERALLSAYFFSSSRGGGKTAEVARRAAPGLARLPEEEVGALLAACLAALDGMPRDIEAAVVAALASNRNVEACVAATGQNPSAVGAWVLAHRGDTPELRAARIRALGLVGGGAEDEASSFLGYAFAAAADPDPACRRAAVDWLGGSKNEAAKEVARRRASIIVDPDHVAAVARLDEPPSWVDVFVKSFDDLEDPSRLGLALGMLEHVLEKSGVLVALWKAENNDALDAALQNLLTRRREVKRSVGGARRRLLDALLRSRALEKNGVLDDELARVLATALLWSSPPLEDDDDGAAAFLAAWWETERDCSPRRRAVEAIIASKSLEMSEKQETDLASTVLGLLRRRRRREPHDDDDDYYYNGGGDDELPRSLVLAAARRLLTTSSSSSEETVARLWAATLRRPRDLDAEAEAILEATSDRTSYESSGVVRALFATLRRLERPPEALFEAIEKIGGAERTDVDLSLTVRVAERRRDVAATRALATVVRASPASAVASAWERLVDVACTSHPLLLLPTVVPAILFFPAPSSSSSSSSSSLGAVASRVARLLLDAPDDPVPALATLARALDAGFPRRGAAVVALFVAARPSSSSDDDAVESERAAFAAENVLARVDAANVVGLQVLARAARRLAQSAEVVLTPADLGGRGSVSFSDVAAAESTAVYALVARRLADDQPWSRKNQKECLALCHELALADEASTRATVALRDAIRLLSTPQSFVAFVQHLLGSDRRSARDAALAALHDRLRTADLFFSGDQPAPLSRLLLEEMVPSVAERLASPDASTALAATRAADVLARRLAPRAPSPFAPLLEAAATAAALAARALSPTRANAAFSLLSTLFATLRVRALPALETALPRVLDAVRSARAHRNAALEALLVVVSSVPKFVHAHLAPILDLLVDDDDDDDEAGRRRLAKALAAGVEPRLLLPALYAAYLRAKGDDTRVSLVLATTKPAVDALGRSAARSHAPRLAALSLAALEGFPSRDVETRALDLTLSLLLKLTERDLVDWLRAAAAWGLVPDASRRAAFYLSLATILDHLGPIASPHVAALVFEPALQDLQRSKKTTATKTKNNNNNGDEKRRPKRRRPPPPEQQQEQQGELVVLWRVVSTLRFLFDNGETPPERFDAFSAALVALVPSANRDLLAPCLAALAAATTNDAHHRAINHALMLHARDGTTQTRLNALAVSAAIVKKLGHDVANFATHMVQAVSECLEDPATAPQARDLVILVDEATGIRIV